MTTGQEIGFVLLMVPVIAYCDYWILRRWTRCNACGAEGVEWQRYILPSLIEILLFAAGYGIGMGWIG